MLTVKTTRHPATAPRLPEDMPLSWHAYFASAGEANRVGRAAELILLYEMCREAGIPLAPIEVAERGKPDFRQGGYHFNFSGSGELLAVALADAPVGVDVEPYVPLSTARIARLSKLLTEEERAALNASPTPSRTFIEQWVRKEATVKMTGEGFAAFHAAAPTEDSIAHEERLTDADGEYYLCVVLGEKEEREEVELFDDYDE